MKQLFGFFCSSLKFKIANIFILFFKTFVEKVNIVGLSITDENFVRNQMGEIFKSKNFNELLDNTSIFRNKLLKLGCFKAVEALIDSSEGNHKNS